MSIERAEWFRTCAVFSRTGMIDKHSLFASWRMFAINRRYRVGEPHEIYRYVVALGIKRTGKMFEGVKLL